MDIKKVVKVSAYDSYIEFWAITSPDYSQHKTAFAIIGTGMEIPEGWTYEGTGERTPAGLVWHLISQRIDRALATL